VNTQSPRTSNSQRTRLRQNCAFCAAAGWFIPGGSCSSPTRSVVQIVNSPSHTTLPFPILLAAACDHPGMAMTGHWSRGMSGKFRPRFTDNEQQPAAGADPRDQILEFDTGERGNVRERPVAPLGVRDRTDYDQQVALGQHLGGNPLRELMHAIAVGTQERRKRCVPFRRDLQSTAHSA